MIRNPKSLQHFFCPASERWRNVRFIKEKLRRTWSLESGEKYWEIEVVQLLFPSVPYFCNSLPPSVALSLLLSPLISLPTSKISNFVNACVSRYPRAAITESCFSPNIPVGKRTWVLWSNSKYSHSQIDSNN